MTPVLRLGQPAAGCTNDQPARAASASASTFCSALSISSNAIAHTPYHVAGPRVAATGIFTSGMQTLRTRGVSVAAGWPQGSNWSAGRWRR